MKVKLFIFSMITFTLLESCQGLLDEKLVSNVSPEYLNTVSGFQAAVNGAYSSLRSFYASERGMTLTVFGTDTYTNGKDGSFKYINEYKPQLDPTALPLNDIWNEFYKAINVTNAIIGRADAIPDLSPSEKSIRVAESRFLRAHYYFILVQFFGDIPLELEETVTPSTEAHRESISAVYSAIVSDLESAVENLPVIQDGYGRATKPAAEHFLARVHLTRATMDNSVSSTEEYEKAAVLAKKVINNYQFKLLNDYALVFEQGSGEINSEVIWSVQYTSNPLTNIQPGNSHNTGNNAHHFFLMNYESIEGMKRDIANGRSFMRFKPTDFALQLWNREIDSRYSKSFKTVFYSNNEETIPKDENGIPKFQLGDTAVWLPGVDIPAEVRQSKPYKIIIPSEYTPHLYPSLSKFLDPMRLNQTSSDGSRDFLAFRLAETCLIASEALFMSGNVEEAVFYINRVRRRAAWPGSESLMEVSPDQLSLDFILDERERELLGEQFRWFDLIRTGKLTERVKKYNKEAAPNIQEHHKLRPIPQDQVDRTRNINGEPFKQNPGY